MAVKLAFLWELAKSETKTACSNWNKKIMWMLIWMFPLLFLLGIKFRHPLISLNTVWPEFHHVKNCLCYGISVLLIPAKREKIVSRFIFSFGQRLRTLFLFSLKNRNSNSIAEQWQCLPGWASQFPRGDNIPPLLQ